MSAADRRSTGRDGRVVVVSVTERGAAVAGRMPWEHRRGRLAESVQGLWGTVDGLVLVCATGIAVRAIGALLSDKHTDPAVVCVDDGGRWAIALTGGHHGGNDLAREVAELLGGEAVVTTASESAGLPALDALPGFRAKGDVAGVTRAWLDGVAPMLDAGDLPDWPLPSGLAALPARGNDRHQPEAKAGADTTRRSLPQGGPDVSHCLGPGEDPCRIRVTDRAAVAAPGEVVLTPGSLVVGVGASSGADAGGIAALLRDALGGAGLEPGAVGLVATVDLKRDEPGIVALADGFGVELRTFPAAVLAEVVVPNPSDVVAAAVGTPSVAEAAALAAAGAEATLVVPKRRSGEATVAVARRVRPEGHLAVVGLGPGDAGQRTPAATASIRQADVVVGYGLYVDQAGELLGPHQEVVRSPIGSEAARCHEALARAAAGQKVALVCSGDPGVFAMASLVCELAPEHGNPPVTVVPGITAASAAAAVLGAPLGHDHAAVSLSDLLTSWDTIERRLRAVAEADMAVSFYNPRSLRRRWQLDRAVAILAEHRPADCPVAIVTDVGRPGQHVVRTTLAAFDPEPVGMLSLVVVGSSTTRWVGDRMVTPRGYGDRNLDQNGPMQATSVQVSETEARP